jgi:cytochrome c-type biogenesis protein CcmH
MINGMVAQLSDRLASDGGSPEDWAQLIRSLVVLGRNDEAMSIFREAREVFAADPAALALLRDTASETGVIE